MIELQGSVLRRRPRNRFHKNRRRIVKEAANFRSREASPATPKPPKKREARVYRTGRNVQLNIKVSQETIDAIYAITEANKGWVLGYTLERAIVALKRELEAEGAS